MKEYKLIIIIPNTSGIEVGDVLEYNGVKHVLTDSDDRCFRCSLFNECDEMNPLCSNIGGCVFEKMEE